jgi:hypothetical protein
VTLRWKCPECGLDYDTISPGDAVVAARSFPRRYRALLTALDPEEDAQSVLRRRPAPGTWSAVEYTAHVGDVLDELATAVRRVAVEDRPTIHLADADERAAEQRYQDWEPQEALFALEHAAARLAEVLESVDPGDWKRTGTTDWGERDALTLARNAVHEGAHHLRDVERGLRAVRGRPTREED